MVQCKLDIIELPEDKKPTNLSYNENRLNLDVTTKIKGQDIYNKILRGVML